MTVRQIRISDSFRIMPKFLKKALHFRIIFRIFEVMENERNTLFFDAKRSLFYRVPIKIEAPLGKE